MNVPTPTQPCSLCGRAFAPRHLTRHHCLPRQKGGTTDDIEMLCPQCHGMVHATYTNETLAKQYPTIEQLRRANARILGVVLNRIPGSRLGYYEGYAYMPSYSNGHYFEEMKIPATENSLLAKVTRLKARINKVFRRESVE